MNQVDLNLGQQQPPVVLQDLNEVPVVEDPQEMIIHPPQDQEEVENFQLLPQQQQIALPEQHAEEGGENQEHMQVHIPVL